MTGPWSKAVGDSARNGINEGGFALGLGLMVAVVGIGAAWARRNLRKGRGDRVGAFGLASVVFAARMGEWLLSAHHVLGPSEFLMAGEAASWSLLMATIIWIFYIAMEPYLRQCWPHGMISWTRVLRKSVRDPLV